MGAVRIKRKTMKGEKALGKFCLIVSKETFLHRIVTGDEKWIYFDNPKRQKSCLDHGQPSPSQPVRNIHGKTALLCIWWDQKGTVYYELLKPGETFTGDRCRQQLIKLNEALKRKRPGWRDRTHKVTFLHDNARPHVTKPVKTYLENIKWDVLPLALYSPDLALSN